MARKTPKRHFRPRRDRSQNFETGHFWNYQTVSPRTTVNKGKEKGRGCCAPTLLRRDSCLVTLSDLGLDRDAPAAGDFCWRTPGSIVANPQPPGPVGSLTIEPREAN